MSAVIAPGNPTTPSSLRLPPGMGATFVQAPAIRLTSDRLRLLDLHRLEERHQRTQPSADFLDQVTGFRLALLVEPGAPGLVLRDPLARVLAAADLLEHLLHFFPRRVRDDA